METVEIYFLHEFKFQVEKKGKQRSRPTKGQNRPNEMGKIEFKF
jgi:hypothetical protein